MSRASAPYARGAFYFFTVTVFAGVDVDGPADDVQGPALDLVVDAPDIFADDAQYYQYHAVKKKAYRRGRRPSCDRRVCKQALEDDHEQVYKT